ncbi:bacteriophage T4 gp5 trimerisation domain-containing protein, partial [Flavobacterium oreochromis]
AEKPFVLGTHYNGSETSGYHTPGNDQKVIHTRSGTKIILNDAQGSVFIEDPSGNTWTMDGQGNINVNAPKTFSVNCTDMEVNVSNNYTTTVGVNKSTNVGMNQTISVGATSSETVTGAKSLTVGLSMLTHITGKLDEYIGGDVHSETKGGKNIVNSEKGIVINSEGSIDKNAKKGVNVNSAEKTKNH